MPFLNLRKLHKQIRARPERKTMTGLQRGEQDLLKQGGNYFIKYLPWTGERSRVGYYE